MTQNTILIIDDEADIRKTLAVDLRSQGGFRCLEAPDHPEAIALLKQETVIPNVILVDIMMPSSPEAGINFIQELKNHPAWKPIPVIVLSARSESEVILKALRYGAIDYLVKPYEPQELLSRVQRASEFPTLRTETQEALPQASSNDEQQWRNLHVEVIQLSLLYWEMTTQKTKIDLLERSHLWSYYIDAKGCYRTKTLDRYLHEHTLPKRPNTRHVLKTAHFVLTHCPPEETFHPQLQACFEKLEELNRTRSKSNA